LSHNPWGDVEANDEREKNPTSNEKSLAFSEGIYLLAKVEEWESKRQREEKESLRG
jgi:hypothetical protein